MEECSGLGQELGEPLEDRAFRLLHHTNRGRLFAITRAEHTEAVGDRPGGVTDLGVLATELEGGDTGGEVERSTGKLLDTGGG